MKRVPIARIPSDEAGPVIRGLMGRGIVDIHAKISKDGGFRLVPILPEHTAEVESMGYEVREGDAYTLDRRPPQERIAHELAGMPELAGHLPDHWEFVGDIAILKLDQACEPFLKEIGDAYAKVLGVATVCADVHGVSGEFRRPSMKVIHGTCTESVRLENGIRYRFDVTKVMFASGNTDERMRMRRMDCAGETVVDMFAGIGYFTLPLARFSGARRVFACEKNPESYAYLVRNIRDNGVSDVVIPILADNRDLLGTGFADRILMGYVQTTSEFLPAALRMIREGGMIHYHDTFRVGEQREMVDRIFSPLCSYEVVGIREVKSFAPSVSHYVADVRILSRSIRSRPGGSPSRPCTSPLWSRSPCGRRAPGTSTAPSPRGRASGTVLIRRRA